MYQLDLGRFGSVDRLAFIQEFYSPYSYAFNDPIRINDTSGMISEDFRNSPTFVDENGNILCHIDDEDPYIYLVLNPDIWKIGNKDGLSIVGIENPNYTYSA